MKPKALAPTNDAAFSTLALCSALSELASSDRLRITWSVAAGETGAPKLPQLSPKYRIPSSHQHAENGLLIFLAITYSELKMLDIYF